jgi:hypothetical protein
MHRITIRIQKAIGKETADAKDIRRAIMCGIIDRTTEEEWAKKKDDDDALHKFRNRLTELPMTLWKKRREIEKGRQVQRVRLPKLTNQEREQKQEKRKSERMRKLEETRERKEQERIWRHTQAKRMMERNEKEGRERDQREKRRRTEQEAIRITNEKLLQECTEVRIVVPEIRDSGSDAGQVTDIQAETIEDDAEVALIDDCSIDDTERHDAGGTPTDPIIVDNTAETCSHPYGAGLAEDDERDAWTGVQIGDPP